MPDPNTPLPPIPESRAVARRQTRLSLVWIIPIVAAVAGAWIAVTRILSEGPKITIVFKSAEGLEAGKTKIQYNGVEVGTVSTIQLSEDHLHVIITAQMAPKTQSFLADDTQFWVVRPRISGASITGLGTIISGAYIGMEIGQSKQRKRDFVGLENPPVVTIETPGRFFVLTTPDLGSLDSGTPIYFRRLQVGQVTSYALEPDGKTLKVHVFVNAPYDQYVTPNTRFWHASGIDVSLTASGLSVQTQSMLSILIGGIAFETPTEGPVLPAADAETQFNLFPNRAEAFKIPARNPFTYVVIFKGSVRGLTVGAPVEFKGITIGEVADIRAQFDAKTYEFTVPVLMRVDPSALGVRYIGFIGGMPPQDPTVHKKLIDVLVSRGLRAQLKSGSLLTGALFVSLDFFPNAQPVTLDWSQNPVEFPTVPGEVELLEASVASIMKKLDQVPFKGIAEDLRKAINQLDETLVSARGALDNAGKLVEPNSPLDQQLGSTLEEVSRAARGLRLLADYLERHPEALLRGKSGEAK
jgi:paraquat-inducible protein B